MELITYELTGRTVTELTTEVKFFIIDSKVKANDVFKLNIKKIFTGERERKRFVSITRILNAVKREGLIQLYLHSSEISGNSMEAAYINNKYPSLIKECAQSEEFIIKL